MLLASLLAMVAIGGQSISPVAPKTEYAEVFQRVEKAIERGYYAREKKQDLVKELLSRYRERARKATTRNEFVETVNQMIDEFHDSHFEFFPDTEQGYYLMDTFVDRRAAAMPNVGLWFGEKTKVNGFTGRVIAMVMDGSAAQSQGIRKNDIVVSFVNGKPFDPVESLRGMDDVELRIARPGPKALMVMRNVTLPVREQTVPEMFLEAMKSSVRILPVGEFKIGYVRVWTMVTPSFLEELADSLRGPLKGTDGLIVDLRDGFGGSPYGYPSVLGAKANYLAGNYRSMYSGHIVGLINGGTRSAKEMVTYALKDSKRAFLIGQKTAGAVLAAAPVRITDWAILEIPASEARVQPMTPNLSRPLSMSLEGVGVTPHLEVPDHYDDKSDAILDRALQHMKEYLAAEKAA